MPTRRKAVKKTVKRVRAKDRAPRRPAVRRPKARKARRAPVAAPKAAAEWRLLKATEILGLVSAGYLVIAMGVAVAIAGYAMGGGLVRGSMLVGRAPGPVAVMSDDALPAAAPEAVAVPEEEAAPAPAAADDVSFLIAPSSVQGGRLRVKAGVPVTIIGSTVPGSDLKVALITTGGASGGTIVAEGKAGADGSFTLPAIFQTKTAGQLVLTATAPDGSKKESIKDITTE